MSRFEQSHERSGALFGLERPFVVIRGFHQCLGGCARWVFPDHAACPGVQTVSEFADGFEDSLDRDLGAVDVRVSENDDELISSRSGGHDVLFADSDDVAEPNRAADGSCGVDKRFVTLGMAKRVVDLLEVDEIDGNDREALGAVVRLPQRSGLEVVASGDLALNPVDDREAVHEAGQRVRVRQELEPSILFDERVDDMLRIAEVGRVKVEIREVSEGHAVSEQERGERNQ